MKSVVCKILADAGIEPNGPNPWDIQIHDKRFYTRVFKDHDLGLGESYMDGWWDCRNIDEMIARLLTLKLDQRITSREIMIGLMHTLFNFQNKWHAKKVAEKHYNIGNSLYQAMLDKTMNYSCGYWKNAKSLEEAQLHKMDLICRKLLLKPGLRLLDIGCGWGSFAKYAAENYGVEVVGITISAPQKEFAEERCKGLPIQIKLVDYRDLPTEKFDRVASIGMFEHVGYKNYSTFMEVVNRNLADDGIFLLHTIGGNASYISGNQWMNKYIFPNGMLPSVEQVGAAIEKFFVMEDWHNFGRDYDKTLLAWHKNFNEQWPILKEKYGDRFYRMWNYYLLSCAGTFRSRKAQLWQIVLTKTGFRKELPSFR